MIVLRGPAGYLVVMDRPHPDQSIFPRGRRRGLLIFLLGGFLLSGRAAGEAVPDGSLGDTACREVSPQSTTDSFRFRPSDEHRELAESVPDGARIRSIRQQRHTVFNLEDPAENNTLYRWANDLHSITREWVIDDHLLVEEGEHYQQARVEESERILRDLGFIYDAEVRPWRVCGGEVDLEVITRDIWTFTPMLSVGRSGGENKYAFGFRDANFLGTGKQIILMHESDEERSGNTIRYVDPNIAGTRWQGRVSITDNDDGYEHGLRLERPFFSVFEPWAAGGNINRSELEEKLWFRGDEVAEFDHEVEHFSAWGGLATATREDRRVGRWRFGYTVETHAFDFSDSVIPPDQLPEDRDYSYPWIGYESTEDEYVELHNFNYMARTEDVYVGERYAWSLGWSGEALGASRDQLAFNASYGNTLLVDERRLWSVDASVNGFWAVDGSEFENLQTRLETSYLHKQSSRWAGYARFRVDYTDGLTGERQLTLGGDSGLRGYEQHYQVGDRAFLLNLEERYYSHWHPFRLFRVGFAAFIDVGRAWFEDGNNGSNGGVLANAGLGIRLNSSRAEKSAVIHIDFAFPFVTDDDVSGSQVLFTVRDRF